MSDIKSPFVLKLKGGLFLLLGLLAGGLLLAPQWSWQNAALFAIAIWAFCRAYYFCFYVLQHYADPNYRYAGLLDAALYLAGLKKKQ